MGYLLRLLQHKWYVFLACRRVGGIPLWRAIGHDWSKFLPVEFFPYYRQFYGNQPDPAGFARALLHHWNSNPHHYQYWMDRPDHTGHYRQLFEASGLIENGAFKMPESYVREMVADWLGSSKGYTGSWDMTDWLEQNLPKMQLHPKTQQQLISVLAEVGYPQAASWFHPQEA